MENRKDIGKKFKEKLAHLEKSPSNDLWNLIEKDLNKKKKRRIFFWFFPALLVVGLTASILLFNQKQNIDSTDEKEEVNLNVKTLNSIVISTNKKDKKSNNDNEIDKSKEELNKESATGKTNKKVTNALQKTNTSSYGKNNKKTSLKEIQEPFLKAEKQNKKHNSNQAKIRKIETKRLVSQTKKTIANNNNYEEYEVIKKYKITVVKTIIANPKNNINNKKRLKGVSKKTNKKKLTVNKYFKETNNSKPKVQKQKPTKYLDTLPKDQKEILNNELNVNDNSTLVKTDTLNSKTVVVLKLIKKNIPKSNLEKDSINIEKTTETDYYGSVFYGPTFYSSLSNRSMINASLDNASQKHPTTSYYGFYFKSKYNRYGVSLGLSKINLKISNPLEQGQKITDYTNIDFANLFSKELIDNYLISSSNIELIQKISYFEMNINLFYSLLKLEKRYGAEVFTGFSIMQLDENKLYLTSNQFKNIEFGSIRDLAKMNFALNFGIAFSYNLNEHFSIDANPILKYYLSPFSESNIKPISISVQTGFTYKF